MTAGTAGAQAETRSLKLYFIHTKERAEITYKRNGKFLPQGLDQINRFLRDWRRNEPTKMDPHLIDLLWHVYQSVGARDYIHVVSAYRSPATNSMLRSRSSGVADKSQHMLGKAIDFYIPGVQLSKLRAAGFKAQGGGVGYYPKSGAPFVHLDVGNVRSWPRMNRNELMALFPDGRTLHLPTDGKPLAGYNQALAAYKSRRNSGGDIQLASADSQPRRGFLATLFGGADDEEDQAESQVAAAPAPRRPVPQASVPGVEPAVAAPAAPEPAAEPEVTPETVIASLSPSRIPLPTYNPRGGAKAEPGVSMAAGLYGDAPAGTAEGASDAAVPPQLALNVPRPTPRPDYTPAREDVQMASAAPATSGGARFDGLPSDSELLAELARGSTGSTPDGMAAYLPVKAGAGNGRVTSDEFVLAALPAAPREDESGSSEASFARHQAQEVVDQKLARLAGGQDGSRQMAMISPGEATARRHVAVATGVRTTEKGSKPQAGDRGQDTRSVRVPVPQQVARWALGGDSTAVTSGKAIGATYAQAIVRSAPQMVYTDGFTRSPPPASVNRFTGKAVTFMTVARFQTN